MALADKYMASPDLFSYMKAHYQLIVITCLRIAIKLDSPRTAPTSKEISDLCRGSYSARRSSQRRSASCRHSRGTSTRPRPARSRITSLALVTVKAGVVKNWAGFVDRVHALIEASVPDLGLSTLRPSTVAMASILVTIQDIRDPFDRQVVLRSTLLVMNRFNFDSPCEIDFIRTDLSFLARDSVCINQEPRSTPDRISPPSVVYQQTLSEAVPVRLAPAPFSSGVQGQHGVRGTSRPRPAAPTSSGEVAGQQAYFCGRVTSAAVNTDVSAQVGYCMPARNDESVASSAGSSETSDDDDDRSTSLDRGYSDNQYLPKPRRVAKSSLSYSLSYHSSSTGTTLDTIPEYVATDELFGEKDEDLISLGLSTLSMAER